MKKSLASFCIKKYCNFQVKIVDVNRVIYIFPDFWHGRLWCTIFIHIGIEVSEKIDKVCICLNMSYFVNHEKSVKNVNLMKNTRIYEKEFIAISSFLLVKKY